MYREIHFPHKKIKREITPIDFSKFNFSQVVELPEDYEIADLSSGYDIEKLQNTKAAVGGYNEKRNNMYISPIYKNGRNVHMGVDFWMPAGTPVYSFFEGKVLSFRDNNNPRDYGPTVVTEHQLGDRELYALYGHLSTECINNLEKGQELKKGEKIAEMGTEEENGGWVPHLHFQLSYIRPDEPDMPGVVSEQDRDLALMCYPDPRNVLGPIF